MENCETPDKKEYLPGCHRCKTMNHILGQSPDWDQISTRKKCKLFHFSLRYSKWPAKSSFDLNRLDMAPIRETTPHRPWSTSFAAQQATIFYAARANRTRYDAAMVTDPDRDNWINLSPQIHPDVQDDYRQPSHTWKAPIEPKVTSNAAARTDFSGKADQSRRSSSSQNTLRRRSRSPERDRNTRYRDRRHRSNRFWNEQSTHRGESSSIKTQFSHTINM